MNLQHRLQLLTEQIRETGWLQWLAVFFGVAEVLLAKRNNVLLYPAGLIGTALSIVLLLEAQLYAETLLSVYYIVMSIYGWWFWIRKRNEPPVPVTYTTRKEWLVCALIIVGGWAILFLSIKNFTASNVPGWDAFEVKDLEVPANRSFKIDPDFCVVDQPLYRFPFLQLAEATLAANLSGMAIHFMDLAEVIFTEKISQDKLSVQQKSVLKTTFKSLQTEFNQIRQTFYQAVDQSWMLLLSHENSMLKEVLLEVSRTSRQLVVIARKSVDELYPFCGLMAASPDTEINRIWRNFHTASQHSLLTFLE